MMHWELTYNLDDGDKGDFLNTNISSRYIYIYIYIYIYTFISIYIYIYI